MDSFTTWCIIALVAITMFMVGRAVGLNEGIEHIGDVLNEIIEVHVEEKEAKSDETD